MAKLLVSIIFLVLGLVVFVFWAAGSHGHILFRPHMWEDWVFSGLLVVLWGTPVILLVNWIIKRRNQKA